MKLDIQLFGGRGASSSTSKSNFYKSLSKADKNKYDKYLKQGYSKSDIENTLMYKTQDDRIREAGERKTSRNMLQTKLNTINANDNTRVVMQNAEGGVVFNAKMTQINNDRYSDDLRREADSVTYSKKNNTITIKLKKEKRVRNIPF